MNLLNHELIRLTYLPKCSTELCSHFRNFGITSHVIYLQSAVIISDQIQHRIDVHPFSRSVDAPCVMADM